MAEKTKKYSLNKSVDGLFQRLVVECQRHKQAASDVYIYNKSKCENKVWGQ